jgi:3-hydroxyisobutyrate dehydrogenase-like beta-hydroxyacid dehydrogenase
VQRIGFIGAGLMGHGVAKNVLEKGYSLVVTAHRNRRPVEDLVARGAREVAGPAEIARQSDVIMTCVSDSPVLERVAQDLLEGTRPGQVLIDLTTADPVATRRLAARLAEAGVRMLDAPMTLTPKEAWEGTLNLLVGGDADLVDEMRPLLETFSVRIFHAGPVGAGHSLKLINNVLSLGTTALVIEAVVTAMKAGIDPRLLHEVVTNSGGDSRVFRRMVPFLWGEGAAGGMFAIRNAEKDVRYFTDLARAHGVERPIAETVRHGLALATALGHGDAMLPELFRHHGRLAGLELDPRRAGDPSGT